MKKHKKSVMDKFILAIGTIILIAVMIYFWG